MYEVELTAIMNIMQKKEDVKKNLVIADNSDISLTDKSVESVTKMIKTKTDKLLQQKERLIRQNFNIWSNELTKSDEGGSATYQNHLHKLELNEKKIVEIDNKLTECAELEKDLKEKLSRGTVLV